MATFTRNGQPLAYGPITVGEGEDAIVHPAYILDLWTDAELAAIGITRTIEPPAPPTPPRIIDRITFLRRFTMDEMGDIESSADGKVKAFLRLLSVVSAVDLDTEETQNGVGYLALQGLVAPERAAEILA